MKEVAVVIANWNSAAFIQVCLDSLRTQTMRDFDLIVVDNGSTDGSADMIATAFPDARLIRFDHNTGFAIAYNRGIAEALHDPSIRYVIVLNNDVEVDSRYIEQMVEAARAHPDAAAIQPKVMNYYEKNRIDNLGILIATDMSALQRGEQEIDNGQYDTACEIFGAGASAALYTRIALQKTALSKDEFFDNDYFAYFEDVDLAWRLRLAGCIAWYAPDAILYHMQSLTAKKRSEFKAFHMNRNHWYNIVKDLPVRFCVRAVLLLPRRYILFFLSRFSKGSKVVQAKEQAQSQAQSEYISFTRIFFRSLIDVARHLPALLRKRRRILRTRVVSNHEVAQWFRDYHADIKKIIFGSR